jgi:hypothetical protein
MTDPDDATTGDANAIEVSDTSTPGLEGAPAPPAADAIRCSYRWTPDEIGESQRLYAKAQSIMQKIGAGMIGLGFAGYGVYVLATTDGDTTSVLSGIVLVLCGTFLVGLRTVFSVWIVKRRHAKRPDAQHELTHSIDDDAVHTVVPGMAQSRVAWNHFVLAVIGQSGTLLFLTPRQYQWVPHHPLSDADVTRLHALVRAKVPKIKAL